MAGSRGINLPIQVFLRRKGDLTSFAKKCVPENWALKQKVITQLDNLAPAHTIIASNSSSYGISEIIEGLDLKHKNRILSAHCCTRPAILSTLLEICLLTCQFHADWPPETSGRSIWVAVHSNRIS
jgi:hypothetical protein